MSTKKFDQEINVFHNGVRNGSEKFLQYKSSHTEWDCPCIMFNRTIAPLDTFAYIINDGFPSLHTYSVNGQEHPKSSAEPNIQLIVKNEGNSACNILFEKETEPPKIIGCEDMVPENNIDLLYVFARTQNFTHLCIFNKAISLSGLSLFTTDDSIAKHFISLFIDCIKRYNLNMKPFDVGIDNGNQS